MKNLFTKSILALSLVVAANAGEKIKVGASVVPHAEILNFIKPALAKEGYDLEVTEISDYNIPNQLTHDGELDANYYQHIPYLKESNKNNGTNLVAITPVHLEPIGAYSKKIKDIKELKDGARVAIQNDPTNENRALELLAGAGLIKLNDEPLKTVLDIIENPKNLKFIETEAGQIPRVLDDVDLATINTNFALLNGLVPKKDALIIESPKDNPYVNYLVTKPENKDKDKIKALSKALNSKEVKDFINTKYEGSVIPAF